MAYTYRLLINKRLEDVKFGGHEVVVGMSVVEKGSSRGGWDGVEELVVEEVVEKVVGERV